MTTLKNKHLSFEDRCIIQEFLDYGYPFTRIGARIHKDRTTVAKEVLHHRFMKGSFQTQCELTDRPPYVCNGCDRKARCRKSFSGKKQKPPSHPFVFLCKLVHLHANLKTSNCNSRNNGAKRWPKAVFELSNEFIEDERVYIIQSFRRKLRNHQEHLPKGNLQP